MRRQLAALSLAATFAVATPASATTIEEAFTRVSAGENLSVAFTSATGILSAQAYSRFVEINVSGTGQSAGTSFNDAFHLYSGGGALGNYYQLGIGTALIPFTAGSPTSYATQYVTFVNGPGAVPLGTRPTYDPTHNYRFVIDLGSQPATALQFGVLDGDFTDNSGGYSLSIYQLVAGASAVPEPGSWLMMIAGFGMVGAALRTRRRVAIRVA